jgi:hypothetical protein
MKIEPYMIRRNQPETTARRWRRNFHHISCHCEAV